MNNDQILTLLVEQYIKNIKALTEEFSRIFEIIDRERVQRNDDHAIEALSRAIPYFSGSQADHEKWKGFKSEVDIYGLALDVFNKQNNRDIKES